jgi:hypothetical protein
MANSRGPRLFASGLGLWRRCTHSLARPLTRVWYMLPFPLVRRSVFGHGENLSNANLAGKDLRWAFLWEANLEGALLSQANLTHATLAAARLERADLRGANLRDATLVGADLRRADLTDADLVGADLRSADLRGACLAGANLTAAVLVRARLQGADFSNCRVYGVSAWDVKVNEATRMNLIITPKTQPAISVDNLEVAQFIYLLLDNTKVRNVIDTIGKKAVLILGRFTPERKAVLEAIRDKLREYGYLPILFDFDPPRSRDLTETVATLAHLSRFIIADLTEPRSIPQELSMVVPNLRSVPVQPILADADREWGMFEHFTAYPWVLPIHKYHFIEDLLADLKDKVIAPAEQKADELRVQRGIGL